MSDIFSWYKASLNGEDNMYIYILKKKGSIPSYPTWWNCINMSVTNLEMINVTLIIN